MKNVKIKISKESSELIKKEFDLIFPLIKMAEDITVRMSGWDIYDRDGNLVMWGEEELEKLSKGDPKIKESIKYVFDNIISKGGNYANSAYTLYFRGNQKFPKLEEYEGRFEKKNKRKPETEEEFKKVQDSFGTKLEQVTHYTRLEKFGIFPLTQCHNSIAKSTLKTVFSKIDSVIKQRDECFKNHTELKAKSNELIRNSGLSSDNIQGIRNLVSVCDSVKCPLNPKAINFISQQGDVIPEHGKWKDAKGNNRSYTLNKTIVDYLNSNRDLITSMKIENIRKFLYDFLSIQDKLKNNKQIPAYTFFNRDTFKLEYDFKGNNCPKAIFIGHDEVSSQWKFASGLDPKVFVHLKCRHKKIGRTNYQLQDLSVEAAGNGYDVKFKTNGKYPVKGNVTNPSINYKNGNYFVNLPINEEVDEKELALIADVRKNLSTGLTLSTEYDIKEKNHHKICQTKGPFRVLGVDLNLKGVAITVKEYDPRHRKWKISGQNWLVANRGEVASYIEFGNKINSTRLAMSATKEIYSYILSKSPDEPTSVKKYPDIYKFVLRSVENGVKPIHFKNDPSWPVKGMLDQCRKAFSQLKKTRIEDGYDFASSFYYTQFVKSHKSLLTAYSKFGTDPSRETEGGINSWKKNQTCKNINDLYRNIKIDTEKKFAAHIKNLAIKHGAKIVILEALSEQTGNKYENTKKENELNLQWNPGGIKKYLEPSLNSVGILMSEVSEYLTSQMCPEKNEIGLRDGNFLYTKSATGDIIRRNCHITASENIVNQFVNNRGIPFTFNVELQKDEVKSGNRRKKSKNPNSVDGRYVLCSGRGDSESKLLKYMLQKEFGEEYKKLTLSFSNIPVDKKTGEPQTKFRIFKIEGKWVTEADKDIHLKAIEASKSLDKTLASG